MTRKTSKEKKTHQMFAVFFGLTGPLVAVAVGWTSVRVLYLALNASNELQATQLLFEGLILLFITFVVVVTTWFMMRLLRHEYAELWKEICQRS